MLEVYSCTIMDRVCVNGDLCDFQELSLLISQFRVISPYISVQSYHLSHLSSELSPLNISVQSYHSLHFSSELSSLTSQFRVVTPYISVEVIALHFSVQSCHPIVFSLELSPHSQQFRVIPPQFLVHPYHVYGLLDIYDQVNLLKEIMSSIQ